MGRDLGLNRAVFLDRDGVVNQAIIRAGKPYPPANVAETVIAAGAQPALNRLKELGYLLIVVTNQPDVARGAVSRSGIEEIHSLLRTKLPLDDVFACFHDDADHCACRKPLPGMMLEAAEKHRVDLQRSYLIGDRWRDIEAGTAAGCRTIFIDYRYAERGPQTAPDQTVCSLAEAVDWIFKQETNATE